MLAALHLFTFYYYLLVVLGFFNRALENQSFLFPVLYSFTVVSISWCLRLEPGHLL